MPWGDLYISHNTAEVGGCANPPAKAMCSECCRRRETVDMLVETNPNSGNHGFLVCKEPHEQGGCFEGPQIDMTKPAKSDDIGPIPNIFY